MIDEEKFITFPSNLKRVYVTQLYDNVKPFNESCPNYHKMLEELKLRIIQISHPDWVKVDEN